jgi:hypothetical protein
MIGTTRSRVSFFMNRFRKLGFIKYNGRIKVHKSLLNADLLDRLPTLPPDRPPSSAAERNGWRPFACRCGWGADNRRGRTQVGKMHGFASPLCLQDGRQFWSPGYRVWEFIEDKSKAPCAVFASLCLLRSIAKKSVARNNNFLGGDAFRG